jgi:signal transduction histidine kinase
VRLHYPKGPARRLLIATVVTSLLTVALAIVRPQFLIRIDNDLYDVMTRTTVREPPAGRVLIVDIDERSLADIGQWPWPRDVVARLIDDIRARGTSAIALDIVFPERDREARVPSDGALPRATDGVGAPPTVTDAILARTLEQGGVVLGYAMTFDEAVPHRTCVLHPLRAALVESARESGPRLYRATGAICNLPVLAEAAGASGFLNAAPDSDGVLRRVPLVIESGDQIYPSLALAAAVSATHERELALRVNDAQTRSLTFGARSVPLDGNGNVLVRFLGPDRTFRYVSAADVLADRVEAEMFRGKLVFIGATALGTQEDIATSVQPLFPGVEIQATVAESLLEGRFVSRPGYAPFVEAVLLLLVIPMVWVVSRAGAVWGAAGLVSMWALLWFAAWRLFATGVFVSPVLGIAAGASGYVATVIARLRYERGREAARATEARRAADAAESITDEVLRKTSHELRTPLTVIAGWAHLLGIGALSDRQKSAALDTIKQNVKAQTKLIEDLVDASKLADDDLRLQLRRMDLRDVARPAIAHYAGIHEAKRIRFDAQVDALPCIVAGDPERLRQVLDALLSNAAKFTPEGGSVSLRLARAGANVEIQVSDTGVGIAPEFLPHAFERFRQEHDMTRRPDGGLGLGLTIVRKLVQLHGGSVSVESKGENQGTTFRVWLPAADDTPDPRKR